jgi:leucyl aminopeptidase
LKAWYWELTAVKVHADAASRKAVEELKAVMEATCTARDLVNEPQSYLTAPQFSKEIQAQGKACGFSVKVFDKKKIESLKMGGILAVNMGSITPPRFNILEWNPKGAKNKKPIVLVGKGIVYDTGGLSLKPTADSMDFMKCDMGGAATVVGAFIALSKAKLPLHVIGLIPSTDNRPGLNAYAPGDVITMYNGSTVEVLNTDAEGRLVLADALHYAKKYKPELVLDFATLTGAASRAIGKEGLCYMGNADQKVKNKIEESGHAVYERLVHFPLWREYGDQIKSNIADIKNLGGPSSGMITAGKFLEHFIDYPWLHFDIAGPAYLKQADGYRTKEGTGSGVRMMFDFLKNYSA